LAGGHGPLLQRRRFIGFPRSREGRIFRMTPCDSQLRLPRERGDPEDSCSYGTFGVVIVPTLPRGNASQDAPASGRGASKVALPRRSVGAMGSRQLSSPPSPPA